MDQTMNQGTKDWEESGWRIAPSTDGEGPEPLNQSGFETRLEESLHKHKSIWQELAGSEVDTEGPRIASWSAWGHFRPSR